MPHIRSAAAIRGALTDNLGRVSGVSQAAPHVTALVCLLREMSPDLMPDQILQVMHLTGVPVFDPETDRSYSRADFLGAVQGISATTDCDLDGQADFREIAFSESHDCNSNLVLDTCELESDPTLDCDVNGVIDECEHSNAECFPKFVRGDANLSGEVDFTDSIDTLGFLFLGEPLELQCEKSADVNDDARVDISDPINVFHFLFLGSEPIHSPYPRCGGDPTPDQLSCRTQCES
jgi:hypothetical protein